MNNDGNIYGRKHEGRKEEWCEIAIIYVKMTRHEETEEWKISIIMRSVAIWRQWRYEDSKKEYETNVNGGMAIIRYTWISMKTIEDRHKQWHRQQTEEWNVYEYEMKRMWRNWRNEEWMRIIY